MAWIVYMVIVLAVSGLVGMHLGRFREAYTEMTGMMAGMTMGMLNGFVLGFGAASAANSMFWGNLFGILLGLVLGIYFGRPGGLMGIMDGAMGGVMGGSMGAMLAVMVVFPQYGQFWTAVLLAGLYVLGMAGLVVLIERSAPGHAALHRLAPFFTRAVAEEIDEAADEAGMAEKFRRQQRGRRPDDATARPPQPARERRLVDYYALLGVPRDATSEQICEAYLLRIGEFDLAGGPPAGERRVERLERGLAVLTDAHRRAAYDLELARHQAPEWNHHKKLEGDAEHEEDVRNRARSPEGKTAQPRESTAKIPLTLVAHTPSAAGSVPVQASGRTAAGVVSVRGSVAPIHRTARVQNGQGPPAPMTKKASKLASTQQTRHQQTHPTHRKQQNNALPISWVGMIAIVVILVALSWWVLVKGNGAGVGVDAHASSGARVGTLLATSPTGGLQLALSLDPDPPQAGPVSLTLDVKDAADQPMTGAQVMLSLDMTNMNMGPQTAQMTEMGAGKYKARAAFSMGGPWRVSVEVTREGQAPSRAYFDVQVR